MIVDLLKGKDLVFPKEESARADVIIVNNKELLEMVSIFDDNYWFQPEKVE